MNKEYITIKEFAARANISRQGAYKIINKKFQNYCKIIENKKYIDISAVEKLQKAGDKSCQLGDKIVCGDCQLGDKNVALSLQQGCLPADNHTFQLGDKDCQLGGKSCLLGDKTVDKMIDALNEQLRVKDKQIEAKDKQIEIKDNQLAKKDEQIFELQSIIKSLQEQQVSLTKSLANSQALHAGTIQEHIDSKVEKESKKGFWSWLFGKRD